METEQHMQSNRSGKDAGAIQEETRLLQKRRVKMILTNLLYFAVMLAVSLVMFLKGAGQLIYVLVLALLLFYIFAARPMMKGFENDLRRAILSHSVMARLDNAVYDPKGGISSEYLVKAGFVNVINPQGFLSRELIRGKKGKADVEIADVTFPFHENGLNKMFSGCFIHIVNPGADYGVLDVKAGDVRSIGSERERKIARKLGEFIPGSLYLHREGEELSVLLRGRFVGFQINPLGEVHESTLMSDPLSELEQALELAGF